MILLFGTLNPNNSMKSIEDAYYAGVVNAIYQELKAQNNLSNSNPINYVGSDKVSKRIAELAKIKEFDFVILYGISQDKLGSSISSLSIRIELL